MNPLFKLRRTYRGALAIAAIAALFAPPGHANAPADHFTATLGSVTDNLTGLSWQQAISASSYTQAGAATYCSGLGNGWRVPSMNELQTIVDDSRANPAIDTSVFPSTPVEYFWTSSPVVGIPYMLAVDFTDGRTNGLDETSLRRVRCVR
jgi:Protein of unknown function (DUF1566)